MDLPGPRYHLTARPWHPLETPRQAYLDAVEGICRHLAKLQDRRGAIIDPHRGREHAHATPCFAFAVAVLVSEGHAEDLAERGMMAMDHATAFLAAGSEEIPELQGEFFIAPLTGAWGLLARRAAPARRLQWEQRLRTPVSRILEGEQVHLDHRRTCAMNGEWFRARAGLADPRAARAFIERNWIESQRARVVNDAWNFYQDGGCDPESHTLEAVGRANLLALGAEGYDGRSAREIRACTERATAVSLLAQDASGQCPPGGAAFGDAVYQFAFELMATRTRDPWTAGQYRRAAMLAFHSAARRPPEPALALYLAEAALARRADVTEQPAPCEIGGYAFAAGPRFATVFANAGGMQMVANLRGAMPGIVRFSRAGWDSRLGGVGGTGGVSFAPTWMEGGRWVRLSVAAERYRAAFLPLFVHPLLVRCAIDYVPVDGSGSAPVFRHEFVITPDGVLATLLTPAVTQWAVTWPLVEHDGEPLETTTGAYVASTQYRGAADQLCYIGLASRPGLNAEEDPVRGACAWLRPLRARSGMAFVYPRGAGDPPAEVVRCSFRHTPHGFSSVLGRVAGNVYVGRTAAGGEARSLDIDGDGSPEVTFSAACGFVAQLRQGRVAAIETDREVRAVVHGRRMTLEPFVPQRCE